MDFRLINSTSDELIKAKVIEVEFIEEGLVGYPEVKLVDYISNETIKKMSGSLLGCPLVLKHEGLTSYSFVSSVFQDPNNKKWKCLVAIENEQILDLLFNKNWGFSALYNVTKTGSGGKINEVPYDEEILDGYFKHIAVVENPRYNRIEFTLKNSVETNKTGGKKMKLWKGRDIKNSVEEEVVEEKKEDYLFEKHKDKYIVFDDGNAVKIEDLVEIWKRRRENEVSEQEAYKKEFIEIDGQRVEVKDLLEKFFEEKERENDFSEEYKEEFKEKENNLKANSAPTWIYCNPFKQRANSAPIRPHESFGRMRNALHVASVQPEKPIVGESTQDKVQRGKEKYGRAK